MENHALTQSLSWGAKKRLEFIEFKLYWEGKVNRRDLTKAFHISIPQASMDISKYQEIAPENAAYDSRGKHYYPTNNFLPKLISISADTYLSEINAILSGIIDQESAPLSYVPPVDSVPIPTRQIDSLTLKEIVLTIRGRMKAYIEYRSMNNPEPKGRWISPHALGFDGFRWHTRAYCHNDDIFKDFVLGRITNFITMEPTTIEPNHDFQWNTFIPVIIGPNPKLNDLQIKSIELDYGMDSGKLEIISRIALARYLLKRLGVEKDDGSKQPHEQHIVLVNKEEVFKALNSRLSFSSKS